MANALKVLGLFAMMATAAFALAETFQVPAAQVDAQKVYYGSTDSFEKPASIDYQAVLRATPEYAEVRDKKVESGTARYWILLSKASDHAARAISAVGRESEYDLIVAAGYLEGLEPPIATEDITTVVVAKLGDL